MKSLSYIIIFLLIISFASAIIRLPTTQTQLNPSVRTNVSAYNTIFLNTTNLILVNITNNITTYVNTTIVNNFTFYVNNMTEYFNTTNNITITNYNITVYNYTLTNTSNEIFINNNLHADNVFANYFYGLLNWSNILNIPSFNYVNKSGDTMTGNLIINGNLSVNGLTITSLLNVTGNASIKRPHAVFTDNHTQIFNNISVTQPINFTISESSYLININNYTNISVLQNGIYRFTIMPLFLSVSGTVRTFEFWIQKNGVDVPRSNTLVTLSSNGVAQAYSITYQIDLILNDSVRFMWYSDKVGQQLVYYPESVSPSRPSTPSVILDILKVSELT